jgi:Polyketide cyclase / dehydrase and lipid transport
MGDTYEVVRTRTIDAPTAVIHDLITDFQEWRRWSPWEDLDPDLQRTYSGAERGVGSVYEWSGNRKAGQGRMEVTGDEPLEVVVAVTFLKPFKSASTATFTLAPAGAGTEVTWTMVGPKTIATRVMGLFTSMDKMIGPDFEKGLTRLKAAAET